MAAFGTQLYLWVTPWRPSVTYQTWIGGRGGASRRGLLSASVLRKGYDPQWRLPFWSTMEVPAVVETMADADRYFEAAIGRQ